MSHIHIDFKENVPSHMAKHKWVCVASESDNMRPIVH